MPKSLTSLLLATMAISGTGQGIAAPPDPPPPPQAELSVSVDDGVTSAQPGGQITYVILVQNGGPAHEPSARVVDNFPAQLSCSWTSEAFGGATGNGEASGNLDEFLEMPSGSSVQYDATCDIDPLAMGTLVNTVTVEGTLLDTNPDDNEDSDDDTQIQGENVFSDGFEDP